MPAPRPSALPISTVTRRNPSAISARCGGSGSAAVRTLTDGDLDLARLATSKNADDDPLTNAIGPQDTRQLLGLGDRMAVDRQDDVADDEARGRRRSVWPDVDHDDGASLRDTDLLAKRIGQFDRLRA